LGINQLRDTARTIAPDLGMEAGFDKLNRIISALLATHPAKGLVSASAKALYMMFLISEVHPFLDGNGRIARVMMNAELVNAGESKIIIPTVYRDDYIGALRRLTRQGDCDPYIRMMDRAHAFSENVYGDNRNEMESYLRTCNAFYEDNEGRILQIVSSTK